MSVFTPTLHLSSLLQQVLELLLHHLETFGEHLDEMTFQEMRQQQMKQYYCSILKPDKVRK